MAKLLIFDAFTRLICKKGMSQITHFCGVKSLARKSGSVKFGQISCLYWIITILNKAPPAQPCEQFEHVEPGPLL